MEMKDYVFFQHEQRGDYFCIDPASKRTSEIFGDLFTGYRSFNDNSNSIIKQAIPQSLIFCSKEITRTKLPSNWLKGFIDVITNGEKICLKN